MLSRSSSSIPSQKKKQKRKRSVVYAIPGQVIANEVVATLRYTDRIALTSVNGAATTHVFNLNSIFDPDYTGSGHKPLGYTVYESLYNKYRVLECSWKIEATSLSYSAVMTVTPQNSITGAGFSYLVAERDQSEMHIVPIQPNHPVKFNGKVKLHQLTGRSLSEYKTDDIYSANFGFSPVELMGLGLYQQEVTGQSVTNSMVVAITLTYKVVMYDPKSL